MRSLRFSKAFLTPRTGRVMLSTTRVYGGSISFVCVFYRENQINHEDNAQWLLFFSCRDWKKSKTGSPFVSIRPIYCISLPVFSPPLSDSRRKYRNNRARVTLKRGAHCSCPKMERRKTQGNPSSCKIYRQQGHSTHSDIPADSAFHKSLKERIMPCRQ